MKEKVKNVVRNFMQNVRYAINPNPGDWCLGYSYQIPNKHQEISCFWFEAVSKCEVRTIYEKSIRCYDVEQIDKNIWKVKSNDAYYLLMVLGLKPLNTHFLFSPFAPVEGQTFKCTKVDFDSNDEMYIMPWYTDIVESFCMIHCEYSDPICRIKTRNGTEYYCMIT